MIYYFSDIVGNHSLVHERNFKNSQAGKLRSEFILNSIKSPITLVSMATPEKKGFFKGYKDKLGSIDVIYLKGFQINLFINLLIYFIYIALFLVRHVKKNDKIILYNLTPKQALPILLMKKIIGYELILELEELYSHKRYSFLKNRLNIFVEFFGFRIPDKFIVVSSYLTKFIPKSKEYIVNFGYPSNKEITKSNSSNDNGVTILYSGRLDVEGGIEDLLEALEYIDFECNIIITGKGPLAEKVSNIKIKNSLIKFKYYGFVDDLHYAEILNESSICLNPIKITNRFDNASFPSKVLTYLSHGKIVVSTNFYALKDLPKELRENIVVYEDVATLLKSIKYANHKVDKNNVASIKQSTKSFFQKQSNDLFKFIDSNYHK